MKYIYKYFLITVSVGFILVSLYFIIQLDMISKVGKGIEEDGFGNARNIENGKAYWNIPYLVERGVQYLLFIGGISLIGHALNVRNEKNEHTNS
ncbi:hypothetical protein HZC27_04685 [Candidatus Roizmanbacteria bacterium]|nr:hypothetical protein [Candidatus Roizmanbacteria bacterium]